MKFKYMIRGLGLGIIMTAAVMGAYGRKAVADARVAVLREYGLDGDNMIVGKNEADSEASVPESEVATTEPVIVRDEGIENEISSVLDAAKESEQAISQPQEGVAGDQDPSVPENPGDEAMAGEGDAAVPEVEDGGDVAAAPEGSVLKITISKGDDSGTVARKLRNAGLIENAAEYDAYLMQHGYDKKLNTGTKEISITDSWQEMAEKLTKK